MRASRRSSAAPAWSEAVTLLSTRVGDADWLLHLVPPVVSTGDDLRALVRCVARDPLARSAFVVDDGGRLLGVVPVGEIDRDMLLLLTPGAVAPELITARQAARLAHGLDEIAGRVMREAAAVTLDDTLGTAVQRMWEHGQESAAVLDGAGTLLGYVALFELLADALAVTSAPAL
jgi:CBS-domain-containing membrane protein